MRSLIKLMTLCSCLFVGMQLSAQELTQTIRGTILDQDSKMPLIGATVMVVNALDVKGATADLEGYFKVEKVKIGRVNLEVSYLGYETAVLSQVLVTTGKEVVLNIELVESVEDLKEVVVTAKLDKENPLNEMASVSARSFSVEETSRYAASFYDPARAALNYAGVAIGGGTDDLNNEIVVRGNSPKGVLWRLEGIEIPNPNHFSELGSSGGGISMLSSTMLTNSDFYTGAFPAEFGNATSGVFDVRLRKGNNEKREHSFMLSLLGVEAGMEGPFSKKSNASYLFNYRYSTLAMLSRLGLDIVGDDETPTYQDLSFKINLPTKKAGTFSLFGLGGKNNAAYDPPKDVTQWQDVDSDGYDEGETVGTIGLSHRIVINDRSYLQSILMASNSRYKEEDYYYDSNNDYQKITDEEGKFDNYVLRGKTTYTHKFNAQNTIRLGAIFSYEGFKFNESEYDNDLARLVEVFNNNGTTTRTQAFAQWKYRFNKDWTLNTGFHFTHLGVSNKASIEPRLSLQYQMNAKHKLSAAVGIHSKPEHLAFYTTEGVLANGVKITPNTNLDMTKSLHAVLGYDWRLATNMRLKAEVYYQYLYDVPVVNDITENGFRSAINTLDVWSLVGPEEMVNDGTGRNYGIDLTLEKFFSKGSYFMVTTSLFDSKFKGKNGKEFNTRFNSNYLLNVIGGKEFKMGKNKKNRFGINAKFILSGGSRETPIDLAASRTAGRAVYDLNNIYADKLEDYTRIDLGLSYRINSNKMSHAIRLDVQNVLNRENIRRRFYSPSRGDYYNSLQTGLIPVISYRIEF